MHLATIFANANEGCLEGQHRSLSEARDQRMREEAPKPLLRLNLCAFPSLREIRLLWLRLCRGKSLREFLFGA